MLCYWISVVLLIITRASEPIHSDRVEFEAKLLHNDGLRLDYIMEYSDRKEFSQQLKLKPHFIMFFEPGDVELKEALSVMNDLAKRFNVRESRRRLVVSVVNCAARGESICRDQIIVSHPTLLFMDLERKVIERYDGAMALEDVKKFLEENLSQTSPLMSYYKLTEDGDSSVESLELLPHELSSSIFSTHTSTGYHFIMFYSPTCPHCVDLQPTWRQLAKEFHIRQVLSLDMVDCMQHWSVCQQHGVQGFPTLIFFNSGRGIQKYNGRRNFETLREYAENMMSYIERQGENREQEEEDEDADHTLPSLSPHSYRDELRLGQYFVLYYQRDCEFCVSLFRVWRQLNDKYSGLLSLQKMDCTDHMEICGEENVYSFPGLVYYKNGIRVDTYNGERDMSALSGYIETMLSSLSLVHLSTQSPPTPSHVIELEAESFDDHVTSHLSFVCFFKPWCIHSQDLAPIWEEFASFVSANQSEASVSRVNCALHQDLCRKHQVEGYPSLFVYRAGKQLPLYTGPHDLHSLIQYFQVYLDQLPSIPPASIHPIPVHSEF